MTRSILAMTLAAVLATIDMGCPARGEELIPQYRRPRRRSQGQQEELTTEAQRHRENTEKNRESGQSPLFASKIDWSLLTQSFFVTVHRVVSARKIKPLRKAGRQERIRREPFLS